MALAMRLTSFTTKEPTAVVVSRYFATSKNILPSAFLRSRFMSRIISGRKNKNKY